MPETTTGKPVIAIRVANLDRSLAFYRDCLGCSVITRDERAGLVTIEHSGFLLLLADVSTPDLTPYLDPVCEIVRPGATIFLNGGAASQIDTLRATLACRRLADVQLIERPWGDVSLTLSDPDGYAITFWTTVERTPEEALTLYETGPDALEQALVNLDADQIDLRRTADSWSIREIVHHLADIEIVTVGRLMYALAEPGREYTGHAYSPDRWASSLDYAGRDIASALALFRTIRIYTSQLMRHFPDSWSRATVNLSGVPSAAGEMIAMLASHALEHIEEIDEIRHMYEV